MTINTSSMQDSQSLKEKDPLAGISQELVDVLQKIVRNAGHLLDVDNCSVALLNEEESELVTLAALQKEGQQPRHTRFQPDEGVAGWVARHREPLIINDVSLDTRFKRLGRAPVGSMVCVPLFDKEEFIGTLTASSPQKAAFDEYKLRMLTIFSEQAVLAFVNARQAEIAREQADQLRDLTRMKANFLSMITHELRSPINAINGYLDLALEGIAGDLNEQQREFVRRARGGSEHLYTLVEDLLLVSRADSGQLRLNRSVVALPELIRNSIEELELTAEDNNITINADIPGNFPRVYADGTRIQQVLRNLISNALRFTPPGGSVTISAGVLEDAAASGDETGKSFAVQVRDTGSGIAPEYHECIFERFYQIPLDHAGRTSGQGLGLAIVKMIVELHGGHVGVESTPGKGSVFTFTIPGILS